MSKPEPFDPEANDADIFYYVTHEIIHAQSSLNMPHVKLENPRPDAEFLSDTDEWAAHAYEHLCAAFKAISDWEKFDPEFRDSKHITKWILETECISDELRNAKGLSRKILQLLKEYEEMKTKLEEYQSSSE